MENILFCEHCKGTGYHGLSKCKACHGKGVGVFAGKYFLYWGGIKNVTDVRALQIRRIFNKVFDAILILFSIFGFLNLLRFLIFENTIFSAFNLSFWVKPDGNLLIFFLSIFGMLFFASRITRESHKFENTLRIGLKEDFEILTKLTWEDIRAQKKIDISKSFSLESIKAIERAFVISQKAKRNVESEDFFLSLLRSRKVKIIFGRLGIPIKLIVNKIKRNIAKSNEKQSLMSSEVMFVLFNSYIESVKRGNKKIEVNILLLELVKTNSFIKEVLYDHNVQDKKLQNVVKWIEIQDKLRQRYLEFRRASVLRPKGEVNRAMTAVITPILDRYSEDITYFAKKGVIDFCIGREAIFESIFRIIEGGKQGAVLVGERGVGKSVVIEGVAELMIKEDVPKMLKDKRLVRLSLAEVLGGGTDEEAGKRLKNIMNDILRAGNIVLDVSNLEYFYLSNRLPLVSLLAESLQKIKSPILATTTPEGYKKVIENTALADIFERVRVPEPDIDLAVQILEAESSGIEYKNQVYFSYDALRAAVEFSKKYIVDRFLPEKAINVIKEVAAKVRTSRGKGAIVGKEDIASIISEKSRVPIGSLTESQKEKLLMLESVIHKRIVGQREAVDAVSRALRRSGAGMHEGKRPIANFLFLGPTGVGKTELSKTIAEIYFGNEKNMIRLDMSEYQEKQSIYRMIGDGKNDGYLTEAARKSPHSLILLDELEKAHGDILNLFLQVLEDGRLTDGKGRTIDFTNSIIIATSNAGSDFISKEVTKGTKIEVIKNKLLEEKLSSYFRPEFLNRFDGVIVFRPLKKTEIVKIAGLLGQKVVQQIKKKGIEITFEDEALRGLAEMGYDPKYGARPLRRVFRKHIEDKLANMLLRSEIKRRDKIIIHAVDNFEVIKGRKI